MPFWSSVRWSLPGRVVRTSSNMTTNMEFDVTGCPTCCHQFPNFCSIQEEYHCLQCGDVWDMETALCDYIDRMDGVQYATSYGNRVRVVFSHNAPSSAIREVEDTVGCRGMVGATQEHLACIDYLKEEIGK